MGTVVGSKVPSVCLSHCNSDYGRLNDTVRTPAIQQNYETYVTILELLE